MVSGILFFALWAGTLASGYAEELRRREFLRTWDLVAKVPFFRDVGAAIIADVARLLRPRDFPGGAVIMRRGERGTACFLSPRGNSNSAAGGRRYPMVPGTFLASWR
jgi:voltage-gated potassium channel